MTNLQAESSPDKSGLDPTCQLSEIADSLRQCRLYRRLLAAQHVLLAVCVFLWFGTAIMDLQSHTRQVVDPWTGGMPTMINGGMIPRTVIPWDRLVTHFPYLPFFGILALEVFVLRLRKRRRSKEASAYETLESIGGVKQIRTMVEWLQGMDMVMRDIASHRLIRLLPQMRATDVELLEERHYRLLNRTLQGRNIALILAILCAYEQVGRERELVPVQHLAEGLDAAEQILEIRVAAQHCLSFIQTRIDSQRSSQTLLRAAEAPDCDNMRLLRPAHSQGTDDPDVLLRSIGAGPDEQN